MQTITASHFEGMMPRQQQVVVILLELSSRMQIESEQFVDLHRSAADFSWAFFIELQPASHLTGGLSTGSRFFRKSVQKCKGFLNHRDTETTERSGLPPLCAKGRDGLPRQDWFWL
jgi:hypothetical protein